VQASVEHLGDITAGRGLMRKEKQASYSALVTEDMDHGKNEDTQHAVPGGKHQAARL
ncbi:unnamed protein product, partial [Ectocarpus sp. 4 AP-2014]